MAHSQIIPVDLAQKALESVAKHFPVKCICDTQMTIKHIMSAYQTSVAWCDGCKKPMDKEEYTFHCPKREKIALHSNGFDYCFGCGVKQHHNQRGDKLSNELNIIYNAKYNDINDKNINKVMRESYSLQLKQLKLMQCLNHMISSNDIEEKKNDNNQFGQANKLELTQNILHENMNLLQEMTEIEKSLSRLTLTVLNSHWKLLSNWKEWIVTDVIYWICSVDNGAFKEYQTLITKGCTQENVKGKALKYVDDSCLLRWGVYDIEKRNKLLLSIKSLISEDTDSPGTGANTQKEGN